MGELLARIRVAKRLSKKEDEEIKKYQKDYLEVDFISTKGINRSRRNSFNTD